MIWAATSPKKAAVSASMSARAAAFSHDYYVASSICEMGMLRVELEDVDE